MIPRRHSLATSPNWAPAFAGVAEKFAGVVLRLGWRGVECATVSSSLFSREGGSPDWVPAFAGKQFCAAGERRF